MPALYDDDAPESDRDYYARQDLRELAAERRPRRQRCYCELCHGFSGGPCDEPEMDEMPDETDEDDE